MTLFLSLQQLGDTLLNQSALATLGKVLHVLMSSQAEILKQMLKRLLADQCFSRLVVVEQKE